MSREMSRLEGTSILCALQTVSCPPLSEPTGSCPAQAHQGSHLGRQKQVSCHQNPTGAYARWGQSPGSREGFLGEEARPGKRRDSTVYKSMKTPAGGRTRGP